VDEAPCDHFQSRRKIRVVHITETHQRKHEQDPAWACPARDNSAAMDSPYTLNRDQQVQQRHNPPDITVGRTTTARPQPS